VANIVVATIRVTGEGKDNIKALFEQNAVPTEWGCRWDLREHGVSIRCDVAHGDGITFDQDTLVIKGESDYQPPLRLAATLSSQYPGLEFEVFGWELSNMLSQRWRFRGGEGVLLDCIQEEDRDEPEIVYMRDGQQYLTLPEWVAVEDKSYTPDDASP